MSTRFTKLVLLWLILLSIITTNSQSSYNSGSSNYDSDDDSLECEDYCTEWTGNAEDINEGDTFDPCKHCQSCNKVNNKATCTCRSEEYCARVSAIVGSVFGVLFLLCYIGCGVAFYCSRKRRHKRANPVYPPTTITPATTTTTTTTNGAPVIYVTNPNAINTMQVVQPYGQQQMMTVAQPVPVQMVQMQQQQPVGYNPNGTMQVVAVQQQQQQPVTGGQYVQDVGIYQGNGGQVMQQQSQEAPPAYQAVDVPSDVPPAYEPEDGNRTYN